MQNTAAALDFQDTSRYNKVYFDSEGGIFLNRMLGYLKGYKRVAALAPLFKMLEAKFDLFVPLVMADIVNIGIETADQNYILVRCGLLLLLAFIGLTCSLTAQYFSAKAAVGYSTALRHALFAHIQSHQHPYYPHDQRCQSGAKRAQSVFAPVPAQPLCGAGCHGHGLYGQRPGGNDLCGHHPAAQRGGVRRNGAHPATV